MARQSCTGNPEKPSKEKPFKLDPQIMYALYTSFDGNMKMACVKPLEQFNKEAYLTPNIRPDTDLPCSSVSPQVGDTGCESIHYDSGQSIPCRGSVSPQVGDTGCESIPYDS